MTPEPRRAALAAGATNEEVRDACGITVWEAIRWRRKLLEDGTITGRPRGRTPLRQRDEGYAALLAGERPAAVAARLGVQRRTVTSWAHQLIRLGRLAPPARSQPVATVRRAVLKHAPVACFACGESFDVRYTGKWRPDQLTEVEQLCPACFGIFCATQQLGEPPDVPPGRIAEEEDDDAEVED